MFSNTEVEAFAREILAIFMATRGRAGIGMPSQALLQKFGYTRVNEFQAGLQEALRREWVKGEGNFVWMSEGGKATVD